MNTKLPQNLYELAVGQLVLKYVKNLPVEELRILTETEAVKLLEEIKTILDDQSADDATCFHRIEAIVSAFNARGILTNRHDW